MNTDKNTADIYSWLEESPFEQLDENQQNTVLQELDRETYNEMHTAFAALRMAPPPMPVRGKEAIWREIFDSNANNSPKKPFLFLHRSISIGKAAAIFLVLLTALIWSLSSSPSPSVISTVETIRDTVYVASKNMEPEIIRDTVVEYITVGSTKTSTRQTINAQLPEMQSGPTELHIVSASDRDTKFNQSKKNSLKHDSLASNFKYVTM